MNATRPLILVVDDRSFNLSLLNTTLKENYQVRVAGSGAEALHAVEWQAPDLILLDVMMPGLDGYEVCRRLKADDATRHIPVVFISSMDGEDDRAKGLAAGASGYIFKPFRIDQVLACVREQLALNRAQSAT